MRPQELNLLVIFDVIMIERSITRAADRLALSQPAVSNALSKMRVLWQDELFVRDGRKIQPTTYARNLWAQIKDPIKQISEAIGNLEFNPATAERTFRVALADTVVDMAWLPLRKIIEEQAPNVNIHATPYTIANTAELLEGGKVDIVIGMPNTNNSSLVEEFLFNPFYLCAMRKGHPLANKPLTAKKYEQAEHLLVSLSGDAIGFADKALAQLGKNRRIACTVNHFSAVTPMLRSTDLICALPWPRGTIEEESIKKHLHLTSLPFEMNTAPISLIWHRRQEKDLGLFWLKQILKEILISEAGRQEKWVRQILNPFKSLKTN